MKPTVLGLFIAAAAFGASTIYLALQLREERAQADAIAEQTQALNARIADLEKIRLDLETFRMAGGPEEDRPTARASEAAHQAIDSPVTLAAEVREPVPAGKARFDPPPRSEAMEKMMRTQMRANLKRMNSDIGGKLGLSQEDASKLIDLMVDQQAEMVQRARDNRGTRPTPEQRATDEAAQQEKNLAEISALIGGDKIEAYKAYQQTMPARQEVDMLSRQLEANDLNLSKDQRDRMVTVLAEEMQRVPSPRFSEAVSREAYSKDMTAWQADYNERAAMRSSSILTREQQETFTQYQQWKQEMRQQFESRRSARGNSREKRGAQATAPR